MVECTILNHMAILTMDKLIIEFDRALRTLLAPAMSVRPHPDATIADVDMTPEQKRHAAGLMRVNHCGEVCAQALYQGQALTARKPEAREALREASFEEVEHLAWTEQRLRELGSHKSVLNPVWYAGSLAMGMLAGVIGDKWNLGFLSETEKQVGRHLQDHLTRLPVMDAKSKAIVGQMYVDEMKHADMATDLGGVALPAPIPALMQVTSKVMTSLSYRF